MQSAGIMLALLLLSATPPANGQEELCRQAAASIRVGMPSPISLLDGLPHVVKAEKAQDASAVLRMLNAEDNVVATVRDMTQSDRFSSRVKWLVKGHLGAVEVVAVTAYCQSLLFFEVVHGRVTSIRPPQGLDTGGGA